MMMEVMAWGWPNDNDGLGDGPNGGNNAAPTVPSPVAPADPDDNSFDSAAHGDNNLDAIDDNSNANGDGIFANDVDASSDTSNEDNIAHVNADSSDSNAS